MVSLTVKLDQQSGCGIREVGPTDKASRRFPHLILGDWIWECDISNGLAKQVLQGALGRRIPSSACFEERPNDSDATPPLSCNAVNKALNFGKVEQPQADPLLERMLDDPPVRSA
jgi:hypothetical protein